MNARPLRTLTWGGPVLTVVFAAGLIPLAGFFPPPSPAAGPDAIARLYAENATAIRLGCFAMIVGLVFLVPWGLALAEWCRRIPGADPALANGQLVCLAVSTALIEVIPTVWAVAAYRAGTAGADVTQALNDLGWFLLLFAWPPFSLWSVLVAMAVFADRRERPLLPRWTAYLSLWDAFLLAPGGLMAFFKVGPFAWDGVLAFYIPLTVFFVWLVGMTAVMLRLAAAPDRATPTAVPA